LTRFDDGIWRGPQSTGDGDSGDDDDQDVVKDGDSGAALVFQTLSNGERRRQFGGA
jgi:hypothetical protein